MSLTYKHTHRCQAKEEGEQLRVFKQKDIFRKILLSHGTKAGSDMTSHRRESEGHRWPDRHAWGAVSHTRRHNHVWPRSCVATKITIHSSPISFADFRMVRMFGVHFFLPSTKESTMLYQEAFGFSATIHRSAGGLYNKKKVA